MPIYAYKGVNQDGRSTRGFVDAETLRAARARLRRDGVFLTDIGESSGVRRLRGDSADEEPSRFALRLPRRVSTMDLALATRQLATLIGAGIPLVESLGALTEQVESSNLKAILGGIRDRVNEGTSLADAMAAAGPFSDLYVGLVRAGETGGALEQVLERLADYQEGQVRLQNRVASIIIYPSVMLAFALLVIGALVTFVLPQISQLLESLNQPLPIYTRAIIGLSDFVRGWWWALGIGGAALFVGFRAAIRTEAGRVRWDTFKLRAPYLGRITRLLSISRFTRTLSTLLSGGIPIVRALDISRQVAANVVIGAAIERAGESLTEGASLAAPLRQSGEFPPLVVHMVDVGERSGELESMLAKIADNYDEQVENSVTRLTALLEPLLILLMVGVVLGIIFSVLVPMLQITGSINA